MKSSLILEGIVTTTDADGALHIAPMGPAVEEGMANFTLRPFNTSKTYKNLVRTRKGVLHVVDDMELLAHAAVGDLDYHPACIAMAQVDGFILEQACRWYAFEVAAIDSTESRVEIACHVTQRGKIRDFFGLNRAKHAVVEAAILATRVHFLPSDEIFSELHRLSPLVEKTGGQKEKQAFMFLQQYIQTESTRSLETKNDISPIS